jgi:hypothetical protein
MKAGLKRIENTLQDLEAPRSTPQDDAKVSEVKPSVSFVINQASTEISTKIDTPEIDTPEKTVSQENPSSLEIETQAEETFIGTHISVQTFAAKEGDKFVPKPKLKVPNFTNHHNAPNPALATNLLKEIEVVAQEWQLELHTLIRQIQDIYLEGPIVNGWLESQTKEVDVNGTATLRHAEIEQLMEYVEEICAQQGVPFQKARTGYKLCGLDESGKAWSRPCPPEQLPGISMAIARYHRLRQMLGRKEYLENRLSQLAETLVVLHSHIKQP